MDTEHTARVRLAALAKALTGTKYDFAESGHCCQRAAQRELARLHEQGQVHVSGWAKRYHQWIPIYSPGKGRDVPKPPPVPGAERMRRNRAKDPELRDRERAARKAKREWRAAVGNSVWETMMIQLNKGVRYEQA